MSMQVLASAIEKTYASDLVRGELTIIWHAGEPLAVPISGTKKRSQPSR